MIGDKSFTDIYTSVKIQVRFGKEALVNVWEQDTIAIETKKGPKHIRDLYLVPSLAQYLLSVGQTIKNGYSL